MKALPKHVRRHHSGFRAVFTHEGQRIASPTFDTPEKAGAYVAAYRAKRLPPTLPTLADGLAAVLQDVRDTEGRQGTIDSYEKNFRQVINPDRGWHPDTPLHKITGPQVTRYVRKLQDQDVKATVIFNKYLGVLNRIFRLAIENGWVIENPVAAVKRPRRMRTKRYGVLTEKRVAEIVRLVRNGSYRCRNRDRDADLIEFLFYSVVRRAELARCRVQDADLETGELQVIGKTDDRIIGMSAKLKAVVARQMLRTKTEYLFTDKVKLIDKVFRDWKARLGLGTFSPHVLRHSGATAMARKGVDPWVLKDYLGHGDIRETMKYYHAGRGVQAGALLDLDAAAATGHIDPPQHQEHAGA